MIYTIYGVRCLEGGRYEALRLRRASVADALRTRRRLHELGWVVRVRA